MCGTPYAWVVGFGGIGRVHIHRIERDDRFIQALILALLEFKWHVDHRSPPDPDGSVSAAKALFRLHPDDDGLGVDLPPEAEKVVAQWRTAKELISQLEEKKRAAENWLKFHHGPHTVGALPGGGGITWKTQERKESVVKASKSRVLREVKKLPKGIELVSYQPKLEDSIDGASGTTTDDSSGEES